MKANKKSKEMAKNSLLAVTSAIAGILGLVVYASWKAGGNINPLLVIIPPLLALILGIISIIWICLSRGKRKGMVFAILGITFCVLAFYEPVTDINSYAKHVKSLTYRGNVTASYIGMVDESLKQTVLNTIKSREPVYGSSSFHPLQFNPHKGTTEWVKFEWDEEHDISSVRVYWYEGEADECHVPKSWTVLYKDASGDWKQVDSKTAYTTVTDEFNTVEFSAVRTNAIRIDIELQEKYSTGVHRVIVGGN